MPPRSEEGHQARPPVQHYNEARQLNIDGRSRMNKAQPQRAVDGKKAGR